jgi:hypothetical protein
LASDISTQTRAVGYFDNRRCVNEGIVLGFGAIARGKATHGECVRCTRSERSQRDRTVAGRRATAQFADEFEADDLAGIDLP